MEQFLHYFCGDATNPQALIDTEPLRVSFYKAVATFVRAYADIAQNLTEAGYSDAEVAALAEGSRFLQRHPRRHQTALGRGAGHQALRGRHAAPPQHLRSGRSCGRSGRPEFAAADRLIIKTGIHDAIARKLNEKGKLSRNAIAEGIINNVRKTIIREQLTDPRFYEEMSKLLDDLIQQSRADAAAYEQFLKEAEDWSAPGGEEPTAAHPAVLHGNPGPSCCSTILPASRRRPFSARPTTTTRPRSRSKSTEPCASARRRVGKATTRARSRCSTRSSRSWPGTAMRRRPSSRSLRTSRATDERRRSSSARSRSR